MARSWGFYAESGANGSGELSVVLLTLTVFLGGKGVDKMDNGPRMGGAAFRPLLLRFAEQMVLST